MKTLTISDVAQQAGIRPSAIRYYESIHLLPAPERVNGRRRYDGKALEQLRTIQLAQQAGFAIAEIQTLLRGLDADQPPSVIWHGLARKKLPEIEAQLERIQKMKLLLEAGLACTCQSLAECAPLRLGFDAATHTAQG